MQIADVFFNIRRRFKYITDAKQYGVEEKWVRPITPGMALKGDCEDFALACRALCREHNIRSRLVLCRVETGQLHCVLECDGVILDSRMTEPKRIDELAYTWLVISGYEAGDDWRLVEVVY